MPFDGLPYREYSQTELDLTILRRVRDHLENADSWITGIYSQGHRHCAIGWLQQFVTDRHIERIASLYLVPVLPWRILPLSRRPKSPSDAIILFNDRQKDKKRVIALFDRAIRRAARRCR
jgi:hypothetical protein